MLDKKLLNKINNIKVLVTDVDGVLTDGKISISSNGCESKNFCVEDGTGVALSKCAEIDIVFLSGRYSKSTQIRADELEIKHCFQGFLNKMDKIKEICKIYKITLKEIAYIGDGLVDVPVLSNVGFPISVPNANALAIKEAKYITKKNGGDGVLLEVVELILIKKNRYDEVLNILREKNC